MLRTPIKAPWNVVSMVCLESAILDAPSLFTQSLIEDPSNALIRIIHVDPAVAAFTEDRLDYWSTDQSMVATASQTFQQTNSKTIKDLFIKTIHTAMSDVDQVAKFLCEFIYNTRAFRCYIGPYYKIGNTINYIKLPGDLEPCYIEHRTSSTGPYLGGYLGEAYNAGLSYENPATWQKVSAKLKCFDSIIFTLVPLPALDGYMDVAGHQVSFIQHQLHPDQSWAFTCSYRLAGKWLKLFGFNPFQYTDVDESGKYLLCSASEPLTCRLQNEGYNMLYLHSNFGKSVSAASSALDNNYIVPTNILWPIQIVSNPGQKTYFVNYNTAGKVSYFMPIMEEIEIYFTDEWGDRLTDYIDCQLVLTFDFAPPEPLPEPNTIKRARRELNM